jgi:ankyrin repeat protein
MNRADGGIVIEAIRSLVIWALSFDSNEKPLIHHVHLNDQFGAILRLLERGMDPNVRGYHGITPLMRACGNGNSDVARLLIEHGARINDRDGDGETPLMHACQMGMRAKIFLQQSRRLANEVGGSVTVPIRADYDQCMWMLCRAPDIDINATSNDGQSALMEAIGFPEVVRVLLDHGADPNQEDSKGHTALKKALIYGMKGTAAVLHEFGASS